MNSSILSFCLIVVICGGAISTIITSCSTSQTLSNDIIQKSTNSELVLASEVEWEYLNPARGDKSPKAGTLWGDRSGSGPTGFLLRPVDGFKSPPHIHNVSYRGVVIRGLIHNDDPNADNMWMPSGSFWTQPKGGVHITAARGSNTLAYIEIEEGPYLVLPVEEEFHSGEEPLNVDESNMVWLDASNITWVDQPGVKTSINEVKMAFLWGNPQGNQLNGTLIKLPAGFTGKIHSQASSFRTVMIQGQAQYQAPNETSTNILEPGSYFSSEGASVHQISCDVKGDCMFYVRAEGTFDIASDK